MQNEWGGHRRSNGGTGGHPPPLSAKFHAKFSDFAPKTKLKQHTIQQEELKTALNFFSVGVPIEFPTK